MRRFVVSASVVLVAGLAIWGEALPPQPGTRELAADDLWG